MVKKLLLLLMLCSLLFSGVYSVEYLNSCGKSTGWVNGETYILNFTSISSGYSDNYCFRFGNENLDGVYYRFYINMESLEPITINKANFEFIDLGESSTTNYMLRESNFTNIHLIGNAENISFMDSTESNRGISILENNFESMTLDNFDNFIILTGSGTYGKDFSFNNFDNVSIITKENLFHTTTTANYNQYRYNSFNDSILISETEIWGINNSYQCVNNYYYNSVVVDKQLQDIANRTIMCDFGGTSLNNAEGSLLSSFVHFEDGTDFIADSDIYNNQTNAKIRLKLRGINFMESIKATTSVGGEGVDLISSSSNGNVPIDTTTVIMGLGSITLSLGVTPLLDNSITTISLEQFGAIEMNDGDKIDCLFFNDFKCRYLVSSSSTTDVVTNKYHGYIDLRDNNFFSNLNVTSVGDGSNFLRASILSNDDTDSINNITITNSLFYTTATKDITDFPNQSREQIKLFGNNISIYNNVFQTTEDKGEYIFIESTVKNNHVTNNTWIYDSGIPISNIEVIPRKMEGYFYNNYLDSSHVITLNESTGINMNVTLGYLHTDNKFYLYSIGNYYESNSGCVDGDNDGICDSAYMSGIINDTKPLSEYPFDVTNAVIIADEVIDSLDFEINMTNIIDNQTLNLTDGSETIIFNFVHDSDFSDLSCYGVFDNVPFSEIDSPLKNTQYNLTKNGGFSEGNFTVLVECYNSFVFNYSESYNLEILLSSETSSNTSTNTTLNTTLSNTEGLIDVSGSFGGFGGLFGGDISETGENFISFYKLFEMPLGWFIVLGLVLLFLATVLFIISMLVIPLKVIGGRK